MKEIKRDVYLNKLINRRENGFIKIITGIRRCGKSYLLDPLYKNYLLESGIVEDHIIKLDLDERKNKKFLNPDELDNYIRSLIKDENMYYVILDEVQKVEDFEAVLNGFLHIKNFILLVYLVDISCLRFSSQIADYTDAKLYYIFEIKRIIDIISAKNLLFINKIEFY